MNFKGKIMFQHICLDIEFEPESKVATDFIQALPITSKAHNIGGEIYFRVPGADIEYDGTETDEFQPGDVVYWRSPDGEKKFSIALLYGNTSFSNWTSSRTSSPCIKIGHITTDTNILKTVTTNESVTISIKNSNIL
jgi:hypothetical protein